MRSIRAHLTYANVMTTIGVFLLLAGGTALAAKQLAKNSVGPKQLKKNSVTTAKLKKGAVTKAKLAANAVDSSKIADGSVTGSKIADGAVGGAKISAEGAPYSRKVARIAATATAPVNSGDVYPIGSYVQAGDEINQFISGVDIRFGAGCNPPRTAAAYFLIDAADPKAPATENIMGFVNVEDKSTGEVTRRVDVAPFPGIPTGFGRVAPGVATAHKFDLLITGSACSSGSGVDVTGAILDVIGTR
jgi:hypothetical protein